MLDEGRPDLIRHNIPVKFLWHKILKSRSGFMSEKQREKNEKHKDPEYVEHFKPRLS